MEQKTVIQQAISSVEEQIQGRKSLRNNYDFTGQTYRIHSAVITALENHKLLLQSLLPAEKEQVKQALHHHMHYLHVTKIKHSMQSITTSKGEFLFVEVPEGKKDFFIRHFVGASICYEHDTELMDVCQRLPNGEWEILSTLSEALKDESIADKIVDYCNYTDECGYEEQHYYMGYPDYADGLDENNRFVTLTGSKRKSLQSLITSNNIPINSLILKKTEQ